MATRREVLGAGLATASVLGCVSAPSAFATTLRQPADIPRDVEALLVCGRVALPDGLRSVAGPGGRQLPVIHTGLAQGDYGELKRLLNRYKAVAGLSSGASLFCIERIAWDHGMRLTERHEHQASSADPLHNARAAMRLIHAVPAPGATDADLPAYRPSRADGIVHAWIMEKTGSRRSHRQSQQEFA